MRSRAENLLRDVYRDLRDRRLLSIALVLLVAILAVPLLLKGGGDAGGAATTAAPPPEGTDVIDPVVVAETPALREYRGRLDEAESRNPFIQQLTGGALPELEDASGIESTSTTETTSETTETSDATGSSTETATETESSTDETTSTDEEPAEDGEEAEAEEPTLVTTRIDVRVGPAGKTKVQRDVESLDYLPDRQHPVVQYIHGDFNLSGAAFIVSADVSATDGKGKCAPNPQNCEFMTLDVGQEQKFVYEPDGKVYRLELLEVQLHEEPLDEAAEADEDEDPNAQRLTLGGLLGR